MMARKIVRGKGTGDMEELNQKGGRIRKKWKGRFENRRKEEAKLRYRRHEEI